MSRRFLNQAAQSCLEWDSLPLQATPTVARTGRRGKNLCAPALKLQSGGLLRFSPSLAFPPFPLPANSSTRRLPALVVVRRLQQARKLLSSLTLDPWRQISAQYSWQKEDERSRWLQRLADRLGPHKILS